MSKLTKESEKLPISLPVLPLRDVVVYPYMVIPLFVGRDKSTRAIEAAMLDNQELFLVAQKNPEQDSPKIDDVYTMGTIASVLQLLKLPDGTVKVLVEGKRRAFADKYYFVDNCLRADLSPVVENALPKDEQTSLTRALLSQFEEYAQNNSKIPTEIFGSLAAINDSSRLVDTIVAHMTLKLPAKQAILEAIGVRERIEKLMGIIESEIDLMRVEEKLRQQVKKQMEKSQREYYLNEQMKAIQKELGDLEDDGSDLDKLQKQINEAGMPEEAKDKALSELKKLKSMSPMSAEATVSRNYLDWLVDLPWKKRSRISHNLEKAISVLDDDHYGLDKVKERIVEYLAVQQRVKKLKGPILCLVGPPGVGKTSLARSIAKATGRKYTRFSLGGVRDEAEIRGHRRTYIGSMPGKILQRMAKVDVRNPLFLLDEIDKMAMDFRGDPSSALLEVLDPEQNNAFNDHYLEIDYDLSEVMFVCTANSLNIPGPLLDRMEIIRIPGYTEAEKVSIAKRHLIPKQIEANGLKDHEIHISGGTIRSIIRYYTREAGVRSLEREIAKICRKVVTEILRDTKKKREKILVTQRNAEKYLGVKRYRFGVADEKDQVGQVTGLAWTEVGGELLTIEAAVVPGKGAVTSTGHLGDVMQESIKAALTVVRNRAASLGIAQDFYEKKDIHIHVPEGATPKDGPSAGIAMCTALVSALTNTPVKADVAMTGEITLRGEVLPIGGLKEKLLAAHRGGIKQVIIPFENERDLKEIPEAIKQDLKIYPTRWIEDVLQLALTKMPTPASCEPQDAAVRETEPDKGASEPSTLKH
jgi:ATP-dependent Lon protease